MEKMLHISSSPHINTHKTTTTIMLDVILALIPAWIAGIVIFGSRAFLVVAVCIAFCVLSEYVFNLVIKKEQTIGDLSAVVTGLLLGLNLYANTPLWQCAVGSVFAIVIVKCFFGGIGKNIVNPAITARVFMLIAFSTMAKSAFPLDSTASATPLVNLKMYLAADVPTGSERLITLLFGNHGGAIGETCAIALMLGGIYLIIRHVIKWQTPVFYILTVFVFSLLVSKFDLYFATAQILSGGLMIGAIYMATDYTTSPLTPFGKIIFSVGAGAITCLIRFYGNYPEGVSFAILLMNILNPYIDKWSRKRLFGGDK